MKTQAERKLDQEKIPYRLYFYPEDSGLSALQIANITGMEPEIVHKTLVCRGAGHHTYVCVVPCMATLDFNRVAILMGEKKLSLAPRAALEQITGGYSKGCCTPIGMKGNYPVILDKSMQNKEKICLNGGRLGLLMEISTRDLVKITGSVYEDIVVGR